MPLRSISQRTEPASAENSHTVPVPTRKHAVCAPRNCSEIRLGTVTRVVFMVTPQGRGAFKAQALEAAGIIEKTLLDLGGKLRMTAVTAFVKAGIEHRELHALLQGPVSKGAVLTVVHQEPCDGAAIALEAWAIGGDSASVESKSPNCVCFSYDSLRWVHCGNIVVADHPEGVYAQSSIAIQRMADALKEAGSGLEHAVRTWYYLGEITEPELQAQRYMELNRARTDLYNPVQFHPELLFPEIPRGIYPASTGIGLQGRSLVATCLTLQSNRKDLKLVALENPQQTPAYAYHPRYSPQSPKFSRAMAMVAGDSVTVWISGTASIVDSESKHINDATRQTEQTIDNIEKLISPSNFAFHGIRGGGMNLHELAKLRVYIKRKEDFAAVHQVCSRRFGIVPVIYVQADVCRPELLVEIEGVGFIRLGR